MAVKSRYQMTNRGRKGKPCWYVEDFANCENKSVGKYLFSDRSRQIAEGFLKQARSFEREQNKQ